MCKTSHFPAPSVPFQEADYLEKENLTIKNASCYVAGSTIISLITHPKNEGMRQILFHFQFGLQCTANATIKIAAFVRSISGKFFWESEIHTSAYDNIFGKSYFIVITLIYYLFSIQPTMLTNLHINIKHTRQGIIIHTILHFLLANMHEVNHQASMKTNQPSSLKN